MVKKRHILVAVSPLWVTKKQPAFYTHFLVPLTENMWPLITPQPRRLNPNFLSAVTVWLTRLLLSKVLPQRTHHSRLHCGPPAASWGIRVFVLLSSGHCIYYSTVHVGLCHPLVGRGHITLFCLGALVSLTVCRQLQHETGLLSWSWKLGNMQWSFISKDSLYPFGDIWQSCLYKNNDIS